MAKAPSGPLFTVVLPTYNRARMAAAAVLSVLGQTDTDYECIVVDDGSTDPTPDVLKKLPQNPRLTIIRREENRGQHVCRNLAIEAAKGRFITFLDSDDLYLAERLGHFRKAIEEKPDVGFWFSNAYIRREGIISSTIFDPGRHIPEGKVPGHYAVGDTYLPYLTTNLAIDRNAFKRFGAYREDMKILEDTELYARMLAGGLPVGVIRSPLAVRGIHDGQITRDYQRDFEEALVALRAGSPPAEVLHQRRKELAAEVASHLLKDIRPEEARALLKRELGKKARESPLYKWTFLPRSVLGSARNASRSWRTLAGTFRSGRYRRAERLIQPYFDHARVLSSNF